MHKIGDDITNMGGGMNFINCDCITEVAILTNLISVEANDWINKTISVSNGAETSSNVRIIPVNVVSVESSKEYFVNISNADYELFNIHAYDSSNNWLGDRNYFGLPSISGYKSVDFTTPSNVTGIKLVLRKKDNVNLSSDEIVNTGLTMYGA